MNDPASTVDGARRALVEAGIEAFGRDGFDAVSTRRIADVAGVNAALISYYFGGKEGLYAACVQHIADQIAARIGPIADSLEARRGSESLDRTDCIDGILRMVDGLLDLMTRNESTAWARIILREQQDPSVHFETLYHGPIARIVDVLTKMCAGTRGQHSVSLDDQLTAATLIAQVSFFRAHRAAVLRTLGWQDIGPAERAEIRAVVHRNIQRILAACE